MPEIQEKDDNTEKHVVIVGGGMAGLMAAGQLLSLDNNFRVTLVEASDYLGGRISGNTTFVPHHHVVELGAEYIHGQGTLLTRLVEELSERKGDSWPSPVTHEAFISAYSDGGPHPSSGTTKDGYYGRYYMNGELMEGIDERLQPLNKVLATFAYNTNDTNTVRTSIAQVLEQRLPLDNNKSLHNLAIAGYANTVGCTDLNKVSLHMLQLFEEHWQEHELEGDSKVNSRIGMHGIVRALVEELEENDRFEAKLDWQVVDIQQESGIVKIVSRSNQQLDADAVIVTVPPPMLTKLGLELSTKKLDALQYIGFDSAVKYILKFSERLWPAKLQSVICGDACLVPEMWFHDYESTESDNSCYTATCFLTSDCARNFLKLIPDENGKTRRESAAQLVMKQLSTILNVPIETFHAAFLDSLLLDWTDHPFIQGGYMYPKVGLTRQHLKDLAESDGSVFFAGEATNTNACCTIQAAMETGIRAAEQVQEYLS